MKYVALILFFSGLLLVVSCKKTGNNNVTGGGKGGSATLVVMPQHGGVLIDSCTVFIKYGTKDAPSDGLYDDSVVCVVINDSIPVATFINLTTGNYYLFGRGYHTTYSPPYLKGGLPYSITSQDTAKTYLQLGSYTSW